MRDTLHHRVIQIGIGLAGAILLVAASMSLLCWYFAPEISLSTLIEHIRPCLPLRYEALAFEARSL